jgi:hypothetical protein
VNGKTSGNGGAGARGEIWVITYGEQSVAQAIILARGTPY